MGLSGPKQLIVKTIAKGKQGKNRLYGEDLNYAVLCTDKQLDSISIGDKIYYEVYNHEYGYLLEDHQIALVQSLQDG